ncbi:MAG: nonstructural protein [Microviridae sp.]|nr:MAG: nonstructural protein [Microviridae sp.]
MKYKIFSIYDTKAGAWLDPFVSVNEAVAARHFENGTNQEGTNLYKNPEDFTLYLIGEWDDETGIAVSNETKKNLGMAAAYKRNQNNG